MAGRKYNWIEILAIVAVVIIVVFLLLKVMPYLLKIAFWILVAVIVLWLVRKFFK